MRVFGHSVWTASASLFFKAMGVAGAAPSVSALTFLVQRGTRQFTTRLQASANDVTTVRGGDDGERMYDKDSDSDVSVVPPLCYLGHERLMQVQPAVASPDLKTDNASGELVLANQLDMLHRAMKKYGGIGIAAPQVGWWTR